MCTQINESNSSSMWETKGHGHQHTGLDVPGQT